MKKNLIFLMMLFIVWGSGAAHAGYIYTLDITIPDPGGIGGKSGRIGMIDFKVSGGELTTDWTYVVGPAIPTTGNWIFDVFGGGWAALYDDYPWPLDDTTISPLPGSGRLLTIDSSVPLTFSDLGFGNYFGESVGSDYATSDGFQELSAVPVPAPLYLLGAGLVGLWGVRRKTA